MVYKKVLLFLREDGNDLQNALAGWTKQQTDPIVFIGGQHIGGSDSKYFACTSWGVVSRLCWTANNPTIMALREAQLLWPDVPIVALFPWLWKRSGDATALGWRRRVLLAEVRRSPDLIKSFRHTRALEPALEPALLLQGKLEKLPPLNLDGGHDPSSHKTLLSPPSSPPKGPRELTTCLGPSRQAADFSSARNCTFGPPLGSKSWKSDIISVAEPGEMAEGFLQTVAANMRIGATGKARKKRGSQLPKFSSLSSLVASCPRFMIVGGLPRFMGRHTQVLPDGQEVGSYLFRRTLRWMVGGWRNRIVICTGRYGPPAALVKAFLDSGAKAVITPSADPPEPSSPEMVLMVEAALEHALEAHVKQQYQYRCHLTQFF
ncbi:hypothetical protein R1sor_014285 [Riccia sorocarpa]|uniref:Uncharacterized protein n=1 Tax=Riccia sorocarpa TaxID=122646 RepID=A0ABD3HAW8_9MARC